jgi:hypothetical protein
MSCRVPSPRVDALGSPPISIWVVSRGSAEPVVTGAGSSAVSASSAFASAFSS